MKLDLENRSLPDQVKMLAAYRGYTLKALGEEFNKRYGTNYVQQSFSRKLKNRAITWDELQQLGNILGAKVVFELLESE